jgi:predicted aspartyl protease
MIRFSALLGTFLFLAFLPGCGKGCGRSENQPVPIVGTSGEPAVVAPPAGPIDLPALLKPKGYIEVPLILTKVGLLDIEVKVNGQPLLFILDTGAGNTVIDEAVAGRLKLPIHETGQKLSGVSGAKPLKRSESVQISVGPNSCQAVPVVDNLSALNAQRKKRGTPPCDGILGNNILQDYGAVIDHSAPKLFMLDTPSFKVRADFFKSRGYIEVPLILARDGFFDVEVQVNGQPLLFLLDTGSDNTVIDNAVAERLMLPRNKTGDTSAGITGDQPLLTTVVEQLSVGSVSSREHPGLTDFCANNEHRKKESIRLWDGLLGNNFLQLHGAVIDHSSSRLFLLDPAAVLSIPGGLNLDFSWNISIKEGRVARAFVVEFLGKEPLLVTKAAYDRLKTGMTFAEISEAIGGNLTKCRMVPGYTGTLAIVQGKSRIDLTFREGRITAKSAQGLGN